MEHRAARESDVFTRAKLSGEVLLGQRCEETNLNFRRVEEAERDLK